MAKAPGRCGRLPDRTPLRTVRESFPSHGSGLSKNIPGAGCSIARSLRRILRCIVMHSRNLAILVWGRFSCAPSGEAPGRTKQQASLVICFSRFEAVPHAALAIQDLTDVGISRALHAGLGFFGLLHAASATRPCGWGGHERRGPERQLFHVLPSIQEGLGLPCYTGSS